MDAVQYLLDVQKNRGSIYPTYTEHLRRVLAFWQGFDDTDRPFATDLTFLVREGLQETAVKVPLIVLTPNDVFSLARANGAKGVLTFPKEYR